MSKITKSDADYIIDCVSKIRDYDGMQFKSVQGEEIQQRLEQFIRGITVNDVGGSESKVDLQALKRDATRYRYLRNVASPSDWDYIGNHNWMLHQPLQNRGPSLDSAIDSAIESAIDSGIDSAIGSSK